MQITYLTRTDGPNFAKEPLVLYAKASSQRVGEWGTNLVHLPHRGLATLAEIGIRGLVSVNYKPSVDFTLWREMEGRDWLGLHSTDNFLIPPPNKEVIQWQKEAEILSYETD